MSNTLRHKLTRDDYPKSDAAAGGTIRGGCSEVVVSKITAGKVTDGKW